MQFGSLKVLEKYLILYFEFATNPEYSMLPAFSSSVLFPFSSLYSAFTQLFTTNIIASSLIIIYRFAGIQLRKVEERRQKSVQKQQQHASGGPGRLDVQAIMEAAFEMRRKALEENDSDEDDDTDGRWSDND